VKTSSEGKTKPEPSDRRVRFGGGHLRDLYEEHGNELVACFVECFDFHRNFEESRREWRNVRGS